jgi:hypothetical protein
VPEERQHWYLNEVLAINHEDREMLGPDEWEGMRYIYIYDHYALFNTMHQQLPNLSAFMPCLEVLPLTWF